MAAGTGNKWFIYHMYGGKMVLDKAENMLHLRQSYQGDPKFENDPVAAGFEPLPEERIRAYEAQYEIKFDPAPRPPLKAFVPPTGSRPLRG
jgi:hypothetical protein